ncbi:MAG: hypothetical protein ACI4RC_06435 [Oscillospiraceae bacterium]
MESTKRYHYDIIMTAPIGDKKGVLKVNIINNKIEGSLAVMKNENYFCGSIKSNGSCEVMGNIKTLTGTVEYHGEGYLDMQTVTLVLNAGNNSLVVTGKAIYEGGSKG